jgi:hypothetical protein
MKMYPYRMMLIGSRLLSRCWKTLGAENPFLADTTFTSKSNARVKPSQVQVSVIEYSSVPQKQTADTIKR